MTGLEARPSPRPLIWPAIVPALQEALSTFPDEVYLVGGVVRDALWGIPAHDVDLVVAPGRAFPLARAIADRLNGAFYRLDPVRETGRAIVPWEDGRIVIDVAAFRGDGLRADLLGRDFTLNALAVPLASDLTQVIDPLDGLRAAQERVLHQCSPASISDDPIRALRAVRQAARFKLRIEPETGRSIRAFGPRLVAASPERVRDEFLGLLAGPRPTRGLRALDALDLLVLIVPEIEAMRDVPQSPPHHYDVWQHTLETVHTLEGILHTISPLRTPSSAAQAGLGMLVYYLDRFRGQFQAHLAQRWPDERSHAGLLMLTALLHDSGKPAARSVDADGRIRFFGHDQVGAALVADRAAALRLSRAETARMETIVRHHLRPHLLAQEPSLTRRAIYRFWRDCGPAGVDVCLLALADYLAMVGPTLLPEAWGRYLERIGALLDGYFTQGEARVTALPTLLDGNDLIRHFDLPPGPRIGTLLELIREAQAAGEIATPEEALALARKHLEP